MIRVTFRIQRAGEPATEHFAHLAALPRKGDTFHVENNDTGERSLLVVVEEPKRDLAFVPSINTFGSERITVQLAPRRIGR